MKLNDLVDKLRKLDAEDVVIGCKAVRGVVLKRTIWSVPRVAYVADGNTRLFSSYKEAEEDLKRRGRKYAKPVKVAVLEEAATPASCWTLPELPLG